ncbi:MAG: thrombospondin type 3 repeat-containing protein [Alphaproteobacteria bacterium]|nr:thrombospondin type 3 repeat-containing protein [Alphaproteobacteria bacterium]
MATENAAIATGVADRLGRLEAGFVGDIAVFDARNEEGYRAVIEAPPEGAALVLRSGEALYGEAAVMSVLSPECEAFDACGSARGLCAEAEYGDTVEELADSAPDAYPLFFCGGPPIGEPTCAPSRPGEYGGATTDDADGDGLTDDVDLCPTVFAPLRPLDDGVQPDLDGDGVGDACDETPLPEDIDGDGIENSADNCPLDANEPQDDADQDGRGDVCDACPTTANPDRGCPEEVHVITIDEIRTTPSDIGTRVQIGPVVVTGVGDQGITVQDPADEDGRYAGIYVYSGGRESWSVGDVVTVLATVGDYYGEGQLQEPEITAAAGDYAITPLPLTVAEAATEPYEGVLVTLTDITEVEYPYDCAADGTGCADPELWQVNGRSGIIVFDRLYEGSAWAEHAGETPVTGVMNWRWERRRIMPRGDDDFGE